MSVTTGLFYVFSTVLLIAAFRVITARNPVQAVLYLVLTFFQAAMVWMLLKAEFLSIVLQQAALFENAAVYFFERVGGLG